MRFYKICGELKTINTTAGDRRARREFARKIEVKTSEFNDSDNTKYCFASDFGEGYITLGILSTEHINLTEFAKAYAKSIGYKVKLELPKEITYSTFCNLLTNAEHEGYVYNANEILERFGLDRLENNFSNRLDFDENMINVNVKKENLIDSAKKIFANETLVPELDRIYSSRNHCASGHPVHYLIECDDCDTRRDCYKIILDALYANHRLENCRYSFVDFRPEDNYSRIAYEALYKISEGGAIIVRFFSHGDSEDGRNASVERDMIENLCEMAKKYRNKVLSVFCFPRECKKVKSQFYENLGTMSFVELREDFIGGEDVRTFLSMRAKENHIRTDKKLFAEIEEERFYLATELQTIFDEWYNQKLKTSVYPQYKDVYVLRKETLKAKPKGSAYDELMELIGLNDAKQVIKKALNYFKMQKLYEEKGVKRDNPVMHMIFSGNPGTAKTTVARLFARIMRENGLLSRGHLVEVSRGDLVGRYVGWTAKTVQAKFKQALGGVLFIDEAYSLVDGNSGSFGDEAINTIVQEMENHRAEVVVIFAGYPDKMEDFLAKNPGLRSRIAFHVPFADYDSEELCQIADTLCRKNGMNIEKDALDKLSKAFNVAKTNIDFGNGRYVRNAFEQAKMNQATRLLQKDFESITVDEITTITADDIVIPETKLPEKRRIGFC